MKSFKIDAKPLGSYDVCVVGGGIAGVSAAVSARRAGARVILIERAGSLGGTLTEGFMPIILDSDNKGGIVRELFGFLNEHGMTCARHGSPTDEDGKRIPGIMVDTEGCKYFFDSLVSETGVKLLLYSHVTAASISETGAIDSLLVATECGNYTVSAKLFIDASGNGSLAALVGCGFDCGSPDGGLVSPASLSVCAAGMPKDYSGTEDGRAKSEYAAMLKSHGIEVSAEQVSVRKLPSLGSWTFGFNFEYGVQPDDINTLTNATLHARREIFEVMDKHKSIEGFEDLFVAFTGSHIGVREGRRIYGEYRISDEDIIEGRRFEDGICLVSFGVDVHKLHSTDTLNCNRGTRSKPYNIPYRALLPKGVSNMLLAGRCISGDFYPHASYRVMGNMAATGEAAGFGAALAVREAKTPSEIDGRRVREFMISRGYET